MWLRQGMQKRRLKSLGHVMGVALRRDSGVVPDVHDVSKADEGCNV